MYLVFYVDTRQYVDVVLAALGLRLPREVESVALVGVLGPHAGDELELIPLVFCHEVACGDVLPGVVVERVADVAVAARLEKEFVEVVPVLTVVLGVVDVGGGVEGVFVEEAVTYLVSVHASGLEGHGGLDARVEGVGEVHVAGEVPVGVVFPALFSGVGVVEVGHLHVDEDLGVVGRGAVGLGEYPGPVELEPVAVEECVFPLQGGVEYVLAVPLQLHRPVLPVLSVADFAFAEVHVAGVEHQLVAVVQPVVELGVESEAVLLFGVCPGFGAVAGGAGHVVEFGVLSSEEVLVADRCHHSEPAVEESVAE